MVEGSRSTHIYHVFEFLLARYAAPFPAWPWRFQPYNSRVVILVARERPKTPEDRVCSVLNKDMESHFFKEAFLSTTICLLSCFCFFCPGYPDFKAESLVRADLKHFHTVSLHRLLAGSSALSRRCLWEAVRWQRGTHKARVLSHDGTEPATLSENSASLLRSLSPPCLWETSFCLDASLVPSTGPTAAQGTP